MSQRIHEPADPDSNALPSSADQASPFKIAPLTRHDMGVLAVCYVGLTVIYLTVGWMIVHWWESSPLGMREADLNRWFEDHRTDQRTHLAELGSALSNTESKIVMVICLLPLMLWMFRRWHEWALLTVGLIWEVSVFGTTAKIIGRDRPPVEQLDGVPTNSWPSGHIAAAVVFYVGLAIVIFWNPRFRWSPLAATLIAVVAPTIVIISRLYLGMHYLTDAIGGVVLGSLSLLLVRHLILKREQTRQLALPSHV